ncbi:MAG: stage III sporulation protein AB [Oscillospiraceae bacterium]
MIRALGALLVFAGGGSVSLLTVARKRREIAAAGELLYALHRLEREIRCEKKPLPPLFQALAEETKGEGQRFFAGLIQRWEAAPETPLPQLWLAQSCALLLPEEGRRVWRELGRRLAGDEESLQGALRLASEELEELRRRLERALPEARRLSAAVCLSASAFLVLLLF